MFLPQRYIMRGVYDPPLVCGKMVKKKPCMSNKTEKTRRKLNT